MIPPISKKQKKITLKETVYSKSYGICQLCYSPVSKHLKYPHPKSASIDHIIPLSRGGADNIYNMQLAHLVCNMKKGNKILPFGLFYQFKKRKPLRKRPKWK